MCMICLNVTVMLLKCCAVFLKCKSRFSAFAFVRSRAVLEIFQLFTNHPSRSSFCVYRYLQLRTGLSYSPGGPSFRRIIKGQKCKSPVPFRNMCHLLVLLAVVGTLEAQQGAQYLETAIKRISNFQNRRVDLRGQKIGKVEVRSSEVPPLSLTKGELAELYEKAVGKGKLVKIDSGNGQHIHAAVHEIEEPAAWDGDSEPSESHKTEDDDGYYYYYYPLKSFIDEMTSQPHTDHPHYYHHVEPPKTTTPAPIVPQYHSHTHQHKVEITQKKEMEEKKPKPLEPLFMAISGFIGMALMYVVSMVLLPKLGVKSRTVKEENAEVNSMVRIALRAIEGQDCRERIACELGKTARAFNLYDNRFVKLFKRMAPSSVGKHIDKVGKYTDRKLKCANIKCKKTKPGQKKEKPATKTKKT